MLFPVRIHIMIEPSCTAQLQGLSGHWHPKPWSPLVQQRFEDCLRLACVRRLKNVAFNVQLVMRVILGCTRLNRTSDTHLPDVLTWARSVALLVDWWNCDVRGGSKTSEQNDSALECSMLTRFVHPSHSTSPADALESIGRGQMRLTALIGTQTASNVDH